MCSCSNLLNRPDFIYHCTSHFHSSKLNANLQSMVQETKHQPWGFSGTACPNGNCKSIAPWPASCAEIPIRLPVLIWGEKIYALFILPSIIHKSHSLVTYGQPFSPTLITSALVGWNDFSILFLLSFYILRISIIEQYKPVLHATHLSRVLRFFCLSKRTKTSLYSKIPIDQYARMGDNSWSTHKNN